MRRRLPLLLVSLLPLLLLWPLPISATTEVLAAPDQEAAAHIWGLWAATQSEHPVRIDGIMVRYPEGASLHLVDPAHLGALILGETATVPEAGAAVLIGLGVALTLAAQRKAASP